MRYIIVLIPTEVQSYHKSRARSAQADGSLRLYQPRRKVEELLLQGSA
jgi:hypothetical protein